MFDIDDEMGWECCTSEAIVLPAGRFSVGPTVIDSVTTLWCPSTPGESITSTGSEVVRRNVVLARSVDNDPSSNPTPPGRSLGAGDLE